MHNHNDYLERVNNCDSSTLLALHSAMLGRDVVLVLSGSADDGHLSALPLWGQDPGQWTHLGHQSYLLEKKPSKLLGYVAGFLGSG